MPGDVFREYTWYPPNQFGETVKEGGGEGIGLKLGQPLDLADAVRAEAVVEWGNIHLGIAGQAIQLNGHAWIPVPFPDSVPEPKIAYSTMPTTTIPVPLADLVTGENNFRFRVDPGEQPMTYTQLYGFTVRVYYDAAKKPHATARITSPAAGATIGREVQLDAEATGDAVRIDYIGRLEGLDLDGDGVYSEWHYTLCHTEIAHHLGTANGPAWALTWDNSWVPDQKTPIALVARVTDRQGLISMSPTVEGLVLKRSGFSVQLCKPYDVPPAFTSCMYGTRVSKDPATKREHFRFEGDPSKIRDAKIVFRMWKRHRFWGFNLNGVPLRELNIIGHPTPEQYIQPLRPLSAIRQGENELAMVPAKDGGTDIEWPGAQVLVQLEE